MLRQLDKNLWVLDKPFQTMGIDLGGRMTVVKLAEGGLWVHSPVRLTPEEHKELSCLGPVKHIVAPNDAHHLFAAEFVRAYPQAQLHVAPGLQTKNRALGAGTVLDESAPAAYRNDIKQHLVDGMPQLNETVFLHGRTLIVTDLVFNIAEVKGLATKLFLKLDGALGGVRATRIVRFLIKDRRKFRASLEHILGWDFDRMIVTHGEVLNSGAAAALRGAYRFILEG